MQKRVTDHITFLNQVALDSFRASSEKDVVKKMIAAGIKVLGADFGWCFMQNPDKKGFNLFYVTPNTDYRPIATPRKNGIVSRAFRTQKPQIVENVPGTGYIRYDAKVAMQSVVVTPMAYRETNYGTLHLAFLKPHKFTREETIICSFLGNIAAQAITIHRLYAHVIEFKNTLDHTRDPMLTLEPKSLQILYANKAALKHMALPARQIIGKSVRDLKTGIPLENFEALIQSVINEVGERRVFETEMRLKDEGVIPIEISLEHVVAPTKESRLLATLRNLSELKKAQNEIKRSAYYDKLTGLPNRSFLMEELPKVMELAKADKRQFAFLFIDLDKFKLINDMLGHGHGDALLVEVAKRLWNSLDKRDTVVRMSSDEFVVLLDHIKSVQDVERIAEHIQTAFQEPFVIDQQEIYINMSVGISVYPGDGTTVQALMSSAEAALRWVKEAGGGAFRHYYADIATASPERLKLEQQLRHAAHKGQLQLHYEPSMRTESKALLFARGLLRWKHPEQGLIAVEDMLRGPEESAVAIEVGYWQIREATRQIKEWQKRGFGNIPISLYVSRKQLLQQNFVQSVQAILAAAEVPASLLVFELSENAVMQNMEALTGVLVALKGCGIQLVMDSFGRGYTSLNHLKRLPIQIIKIDQQFVEAIGSNRHDDAIVSAIISLAHDMGMMVMAKGVQKKQQVTFLTKKGCDVLEGPWIGTPEVAEEFITHYATPKSTPTKSVH